MTSNSIFLALNEWVLFTKDNLFVSWGSLIFKIWIKVTFFPSNLSFIHIVKDPQLVVFLTFMDYNNQRRKYQ